MSSVIVAGNTSGSVSLTAPDVAGSTVITLPSTSGTMITTASSGQSIPKAALPTGSVLQVVNGTSTTYLQSNSASYIDSTLTATITPISATSKILVFVNQQCKTYSSGNTMWTQLVRNSTVLSAIGEIGPSTTQTVSAWNGDRSATWLDSPATTSATVYKTQVKTNLGYFECQSSGSASFITLMEIAA
jgi:hypothetical protein